MSSGTTNYATWLGTGTNLTSAGLNPNFMGYAALGGSNTTITNSNVLATSIILITPVSPGVAGTNMPVVNAVANGSFTVLVSLAGAGRPAGINYLILS
jgi:hypothetical protein